MRYCRSLILFALLLTLCPLTALAQDGDRVARAAQWDGYALPAGKFVRFVEKAKGYSLWHPAEWKLSGEPEGTRMFSASDEGPRVAVVTEEIPDGYGIANYATAVLQQFRNQRIKQETMVARRVLIGGVEGREFNFEQEPVPGSTVRQTVWVTAIGPRAYLFTLASQPEDLEKHEPFFKRMMLSVRFSAAGRWDEEFEGLRARIAEGVTPGAAVEGAEVEAALLAEALRTGRETPVKLAGRMAELMAKAPDVALDLLTDNDPAVRAAAVAMVAKSANARAIEALVWALRDKDVHCSATAARALADRGPAALTALKGQSSSLAEDPGVIVRVGAALSDEAARELASELLKSGNSKSQLAGLQLALALPLKGLALPYANLFASSDPQVLATTVEAIRLRRATDAVPELIKLIGGDVELYAIRALGEVGPAEMAERFTARIDEIDKRLGVIVVPGSKGTPGVGARSSKGKAGVVPPPPPMPRGKRAGGVPGGAIVVMGAPPAPNKPEDFKKLPEAVRLAILRGELFEAAAKIRFRDRWAKAQDDAARRAIYEEARNDSSFSEWAHATLQPPPEAPPEPASIDSRRLADAPTTGETLFPKNSILYLMAPNFEQALHKLDAALSGVQMETVRDQMTFAFLLKMLKAQLAIKLDAEAVKDVSAGLGIDLKAPVALSVWPAGNNADRTATHSAVVARITDRARFERLLGLYQKEFGGFDSFATTASALTRFAGTLPALIPLFLTARPEGLSSFASRKPASSQPATVYWRQESLGGVPITAIEKLSLGWRGLSDRETIYVAYLGTTAVIAPSRAALAEMLQARPTIAESEAFTRARAEAGEIIFFSQLGTLFRDSLPKGKDSEDVVVEAVAKILGTETGALRLTPTTWETVFHLSLSDNEWMKSVRPFKTQELTAPRELLPRHTVLYAGAVLEPAKLLSSLKTLNSPKHESSPLDAELEKVIFPNLQGEAAFALLNLAPLLGESKNGLPAMVLALRLKSKGLAGQFRAGKLFSSSTRVPDATALGAPIATLDEISSQIFVVVTDDYLVLADSVETLRLLEAKEKFAATRDFTRSTAALPENLGLFATYSLEAAFDEAREAAGKEEAARNLLAVVSALIHAFHSQHAFVSINGNALEGKIAVAFDREGRYTVGKLEREEFDVANAIVAAKGLNIAHPTRLESLRLRVTAKQPGIVARVREDVSKFAWQRVDSGDDAALVFSSAARRIPEKQTIKLPVTGDEFAPYLRSTARINAVAPQIVNLAKQIAANDHDGRSVARKLGEWTHANLKWKRVESDTVETLASREADCLEHSELYVALARALGLPARVVSGAAFGGGSFGAHAWVEIYLGKWVEVDPTWGLMDYVDSTHLRFDGDSFISFAMLNQIELEVVETRAFIADYQRDPVRLLKELSTGEQRELAFDLALTAEQALGTGAFAKLDDKHRAAIITAFDRTVAEALGPWGRTWASPLQLLSSEVKGDRAMILALRGLDLLRFSLAARDGAWYITEIEDADEARPVFAEALHSALHPEASRGQIWRLRYNQPDRALKLLDQLLAAEGESAPLLLLKARVLMSKQVKEKFQGLTEKDSAPKDSTAQNSPAKNPAESSKAAPPSNPAVEVLKQITTRWPDFAPAYYALANQFSTDDRNADQAIGPLRRYAQLRPLDPRPWNELGQTFDGLKRYEEAEAAYREAAARDHDNFQRQVTLTAFYLKRAQAEKAKASLAAAFKLAPDAERVFNHLGYELETGGEGKPDQELSRRFEELLRAFPKELAGNKSGLRWLADAQSWQDQHAAAVKTLQQVIALGPEASDYVRIAEINRAARRFAEALAAATEAIKLEEKYAAAYFERACALAQLNRASEAMAALKRAIELDEELREDLEEADLKPLVDLPEFKALAAPPEPKTEAEQSKSGKGKSAHP